MGDLSVHFDSTEFACKCGCGFMKPSPKLIMRLEDLRGEWGHPIHVNSGCRCPVHNESINGARNSYHLNGMAADIRPDFTHELMDKRGYSGPTNMLLGFAQLAINLFEDNGTIIYMDKLFVHVDVRGFSYQPFPRD